MVARVFSLTTSLSTSLLEECVSISPSHTPHLSLYKPHQPMCEHDEGEQGWTILQEAYCECMGTFYFTFVLKPFPALSLRTATQNSIQ